MNKSDDLVENYLSQVEREIGDLPGSRRTELLRDLREHIATARAELPGGTEAGIREILSRLGDPEVIAAAAHDAADPAARGRPRRLRIGRAAMSPIAVALLVLLVVVVLCVVVFFVRSASAPVERGERAHTVAAR
jgi:uncharacterized membrane protein